MTNPLVQAALKNVPNPDVLVNVISRRVRQLGQGYRPLIEVNPRWTLMEISLREIGEGKLSFELLTSEDDPAPDSPGDEINLASLSSTGE